MKTFYWLLKREFWEHRGGFLRAPLITGAIFLVLFIAGVSWLMMKISGVHGFTVNGDEMDAMFAQASAGNMAHAGQMVDGILAITLVIFLMVCGLVVLFYCLGALYDDRRDRSVLFWKSLPVSSTSTVLSKAVSAGVVAPLIAILTALVVCIVQLAILMIAFAAHGINCWQVLTNTHFLGTAIAAVGLIPLSALWALPSIGWLLLCSSWARSKPILWAILVPGIASMLLWWFSALGMVSSRVALAWSQVFGRLIGSVFPSSFLYWSNSGVNLVSITRSGDLTDATSIITKAYGLLATSNLWIGVAAGVVMIAGAIWFRRVRDDS
jgi:ABC-2 type transport system permease protein